MSNWQNHLASTGNEPSYEEWATEMANGQDITWLTDGSVLTEKVSDLEYRVTEIGGTRRCTITFSPAGRMLFDGADIETEDFMPLTGMLDEVAESPNGMAAFIGEATVLR